MDRVINSRFPGAAEKIKQALGNILSDLEASRDRLKASMRPLGLSEQDEKDLFGVPADHLVRILETGNIEQIMQMVLVSSQFWNDVVHFSAIILNLELAVSSLEVLSEADQIVFFLGSKHCDQLSRFFADIFIGSNDQNKAWTYRDTKHFSATQASPIKLSDMTKLLSNECDLNRKTCDGIFGELMKTTFCGNSSCSKEESSSRSFKLCSACKTVKYCSRECQVHDWPTHKRSCRK